MSKLVYCSNCRLMSDCDRAEYCGCCYDGKEWEDEDEEIEEISD